MTVQLFLRTMAIAVLGALALVLASQARAEGGDGSSVVSPEQSEAFETASAPVEPLVEPEAERGRRPSKAAGKGSAGKKSKEASPVADGAGEGQKLASAAADDARVEQAAVPEAPLEGKTRSRSRQADASRAMSLKPLIVRFASENGIPYELADAVVRIESRYNPGARNGPHMGLTQINVRTAQSLGYQGSAAGLLEAETNLRYGLKYLAQAYRLAGGDVCGAVLRYQFGHRTQTMTNASRAYCARVKVITAAAE